MGKITGFESKQEIPSKVLLLYKAVEQLIEEGANFSDIRVSTVTERAGIGKGTAYEYFDTKEEILACAILYNIRKVTEELRCALSEKESFEERITCVLEQVDRHRTKHQCLIRYIHAMTDHSNFNRLVQEKMNMEGMERYLPTGVFADILKEGIENGEVRDDLPIDYMVYSLLSRLLSYMICAGRGGLVDLKESRIRQLVCQSILLELCAKNV